MNQGREAEDCVIEALIASSSPRGKPRDDLLPRRNLNQFRELFLGKLRRRVLERDGILDDDVESDHFVGIERSFWKKIVARALCHREGNSDELGVGL